MGQAPTGHRGLASAEALARLLADGPNAISGKGRKSLLALVGDVLSEPMLLLLLVAGAIYMALGDRHDALILLAFACLTIVIELVQEGRADRAIAALGELSAPSATVIRDGIAMTVPATEVVCGDLLVLAEGGRIGADGRLIEAHGLQVDESLLTGESVPVIKRALRQGEAGPTPAPGGDDLPYGFAGTLVVRGNGIIEVTATGGRSVIGSIGASLGTLTPVTPRLASETRRMVRWFALFGLSVSVIAGGLYAILRGNWLDGLLSGIALSMSMLPEELPVVLAIFTTMGALRLSRARVLARRGSAIEALGAATVLCTDKTGTLTRNHMEIAELRLPGGQCFEPASGEGFELPEEFVELAGMGILACLENPVDPTELAFHELGRRHTGAPLSQRQGDGWSLRRQYGLTPELLAVSHAWRGDGEEHVIAAKGAPEAIAELCHLGADDWSSLEDAVEAMARRGLRILAVAQAEWAGEDLPASQHDYQFTLKGLVGLADPVRSAVPGAVRQIQQAGLRVVMITGDYPATAMAIAEQAGIAGGTVMTGAEMASLDDAALASRIGEVSVFARVVPDQKLRIVQALRNAGEIVAMTGDGVNDAPSLKAADIGIAMGKRGTDVAREAASIVLLDDDFAAIPVALRQGRRIYDNLRKAMSFIFAVHLPVAGLALLPILAGWPILLGPVHIALVELVIDPICSLAFEAEPEEPDILSRPPRSPQEPVMPLRLIGWALIQGAIALVAVAGLTFWSGLAANQEVAVLRTTGFAGLIAAVLVLVWINRSLSRKGKRLARAGNPVLLTILGVIAAIFGAIFAVPPLSEALHFARLDLVAMAGIAIMTVLLAGTLAVLKRRSRLMQLATP